MKVTQHLWFEKDMEAAIGFYTSLIPGSSVHWISGLPADTPVAIVQHASLPQQRHATTRLADLPATMEREQLASPSVIVVGDVVHCVALAAQLPQQTGRHNVSEICVYDSFTATAQPLPMLASS